MVHHTVAWILSTYPKQGKRGGASELSIFKGLRSCMAVLKFTSPEKDPEHPRIKYQIL